MRLESAPPRETAGVVGRPRCAGRHLVATLDRFSVPEAEKNELLGALAPMRGDIVEVETSATGTPLPDGYENAPPLAGAVS